MTADENQTSEPKIIRSKRFTKIALFSVPLLLVGVTMVVAEGQDGDDAPKLDTTIPATSTASTATVNNATTSTAIKAAPVVAAAGVANPSANGVGVPKPTGGKEDEGREGHEGREGRDGHEGGEHEFGDDD